jgi:Kef-type K+ transport system membrane component KefB
MCASEIVDKDLFREGDRMLRKPVILGALLFFCLMTLWHSGTPSRAQDTDHGAAVRVEKVGETLDTTGEPVQAEDHRGIAQVLLTLIIVLIGAKLGGEALERIHQPAVLGELIFGVVIGNLALVGITTLDYMKTDYALRILSDIGVILLLFQVGLESNIHDMARVGISSFFVALFGVVAPFFLGFLVSTVFMTQASAYVHIYVGAVLCATSVGITARVLQELERLQTKEARIILGAAVIDDVLGLIILGVVVGLVESAGAGHAGVQWLQIIDIVFRATLFFVGAIIVGRVLSPRIFRVAWYLRVRGMLLTTSLVICFALSYLAKLVGLHPIVGAFAAGLVMEDVHYKEFLDRGEHSLKDLVRPLCVFLVPLFFVRMGIEVDLYFFTRINILGFAVALTLAAIIGKQVCSLGVMEKGLDRISIGVGMIPRGEVGLIVASIGTGLKLAGKVVVTPDVFSACVIMVIITTLITPPILQYTLARGDRMRLKNAHKSVSTG